MAAWTMMYPLTTQSNDTPRAHTEHLKAEATNACDWRPEPLLGQCDTTKSTEESKQFSSAIDCENGCCASTDCVSFQFRAKEGCQFGGDARLGAEKDGVPAWCEPRPPQPWQGQRIRSDGALVEGACMDSQWKPSELRGQCFGLGSRRDIVTESAQACRDACCAQSDCGIWQYRPDAGCFWNKGGHNCQDASPQDFEVFVGKRKVMAGRTYSPYAYSKDFADMAGSELK